MSIIDSTTQFNLDNISIDNPNGMQGGSYSCKIKYNGDDVLFETPKCNCKTIKIDKGYVDIAIDENNYLFPLINNIERYVKDFICKKKELWFDNNLEDDDIDYLFSDTLKQFQNKPYFRCYIQKRKSFSNLKTFKIFNEDDEEIDSTSIDTNKKIISLIELNSLKFSSTSFKLYFVIKQILVLKNLEFNNCLINKRKNIVENFNKDIVVPEVNEEVPEVNEEVPDENNEVPEVNKEVPDENNKVAEAKNEVPEVNEEVPEVNEEVPDENNKVPEVNEEVPDENNKVAEVNEEVVEVNEEVAEVNQEVAEVKEEVAEVKEEVAEVKEEVPEVNGENTNINKNVKFAEDNILKEIDIASNLEDMESIKLKNRKDLYYELYNKTYASAKKAKEDAIKMFLEAKNIKNTYMLENINSSEDEEDKLYNI